MVLLLQAILDRQEELPKTVRTASESLRRTIIANSENLLSAMLDLQQAFEEKSVVSKGCRQSFINFEKKSQEVEALGELESAHK